jgi:uncharacterized protein YndB with AHSA1/START domain
VLDEKTLARFTDRHTLVYDRTYPHEIDLVWEAVSTGEHLDVWMLPESRVERRLGGACAFGWGGPADVPEATTGTITVFDPPTAIQYTFSDGDSFMRFDLEPAGNGTRLLFTLHFLPSGQEADQDDPGGDLPAGPDTAWRPGFVAGYHEMLDDLTLFLKGEWTAEDRAANLALHENELHQRTIARYRDHIRTTCPPPSV